MTRFLIAVAAALGLVSAPMAASAVERQSKPATHSSNLAGTNAFFFLGGIAAVVAAVLLLPEEDDTPVSA